MLDRLEAPGGAGGVESENDVVGFRREARIGIGGVAGEREQVRSRAHSEAAQLRQARGQLGRPRRLAGPVDQHSDARALDHPHLLGERQSGVERHPRQPRLDAAEVDGNAERAIVHQQSDSGERFEAELSDQDVGDAVGKPVDLVEGQPLLPENERRPVAMVTGAAADHLGDEHGGETARPAAALARARNRRCDAALRLRNKRRHAMGDHDRERETTVVHTDGGGGGSGTLIAVVLLIAVLALLFYLFGGQLMGDDTTDIKADVDVSAPATGGNGS
jgi:hypothetical protein